MTPKSAADNSGKILVGVDSDIQDIIPGFLGHRHDDIESILKALDHDDYETVRILGHSMKGAGGGYGFDGITELGQSMELAAMSQNTQEVRKLVCELSTYLESVEVVYE